MARLKFALRGVVSIALLVFVARKVNWAGLGLVLGQVDAGWAVAGSLCTLLLIGSLAVRWRIFLRQQGIAIPFGTIFSLTWAGQFFNSVLPGSTGGDFVKIFQLCRLAPGQKAAGAATVVADRLSALAALLALAGLAFFLAPVSLQPLANLGVSVRTFVFWAGAGVAVAAATGWLVFRLLRGTHWLGRFQRMLAAAKKNFEPSLKLVAAVSLSFGIHLLNFVIVFFFARSLGIAISYTKVSIMMPIVLLLVMIPITVNGHGLREMLLIYFFTQFQIVLNGYPGVGVKETAIALSLLCVTNDLLWSLPGGAWYFFRLRR